MWHKGTPDPHSKRWAADQEAELARDFDLGAYSLGHGTVTRSIGGPLQTQVRKPTVSLGLLQFRSVYRIPSPTC